MGSKRLPRQSCLGYLLNPDPYAVPESDAGSFLGFANWEPQQGSHKCCADAKQAPLFPLLNIPTDKWDNIANLRSFFPLHSQPHRVCKLTTRPRKRNRKVQASSCSSRSVRTKRPRFTLTSLLSLHRGCLRSCENAQMQT